MKRRKKIIVSPVQFLLALPEFLLDVIKTVFLILGGLAFAVILLSILIYLGQFK